MKSMIKNQLMVNHSIFSRGIKYDYMNILTWTILKKTQILNGCETFAFKYITKVNLTSRSECDFQTLILTKIVPLFLFCFPILPSVLLFVLIFFFGGGGGGGGGLVGGLRATGIGVLLGWFPLQGYYQIILVFNGR